MTPFCTRASHRPPQRVTTAVDRAYASTTSRVPTDDERGDGPHRPHDQGVLQPVQTEAAEQPALHPQGQQLERVAQRCARGQPDHDDDRADRERHGQQRGDQGDVQAAGDHRPELEQAAEDGRDREHHDRPAHGVGDDPALQVTLGQRLDRGHRADVGDVGVGLVLHDHAHVVGPVGLHDEHGLRPDPVRHRPAGAAVRHDEQPGPRRVRRGDEAGDDAHDEHEHRDGPDIAVGRGALGGPQHRLLRPEAGQRRDPGQRAQAEGEAGRDQRRTAPAAAQPGQQPSCR